MTGAVETAVPTVLWAERSDKVRPARASGSSFVRLIPLRAAQVYITIEVTDCAKEATAVSVDPSGKLSFRGRSGGGQAYALELQLCKPVDAEATKIAVTPRAVLLVVHKAGDDAASGKRWGRLLAAPGKPPHYVKVDWSKCVAAGSWEGPPRGCDGGARSASPRVSPARRFRSSRARLSACRRYVDEDEEAAEADKGACDAFSLRAHTQRAPRRACRHAAPCPAAAVVPRPLPRRRASALCCGSAYSDASASSATDPMAGFGGFGGAGGMGNFDLSSLESMKARQLRGKAPKIGRERLVSPLFQTQNFGGGGGGGGMGGDEEKDDSDDEDDMPVRGPRGCMHSSAVWLMHIQRDSQGLAKP